MTARSRKIAPTPERLHKMLDLHLGLIAKAEAQLAESREVAAVLREQLALMGPNVKVDEATFIEAHEEHDMGWRRHESGRLYTATCHDCGESYGFPATS